MATKINVGKLLIDAGTYAEVVCNLIALGVTTYAKVYRALTDAGEDHAPKLQALNVEYARRILAAEQEAAK